MLPLLHLIITSISTSVVICTPFENQRPLIAEDVAYQSSIPGGSTFEYCPESDPENDIFTIDRIVWDPNPPTISREQKLLVFGIFSRRIPSTANGTGEFHIPEWHDPYSPAANYTYTGAFCGWPNYVYQYNDARGLHKVCDGVVGGNTSAPEAGPAILYSEDILFWTLPEGDYWLKLDMVMPDNEDGSKGERIFCFQGGTNLDY